MIIRLAISLLLVLSVHGATAQTDQAMKVYPKLVDDFVSIKGMRGDADEVRIYNVEGQLIQSFTNVIAWDVDVSGYMKGTYILALYREGLKIDSLKFEKG